MAVVPRVFLDHVHVDPAQRHLVAVAAYARVGEVALSGDLTAARALGVPDMAKLRYVFDAVFEIKRALAQSVPLIGFAGSPFTLACYMIEGGGSTDFAIVRRMAHARPDLLQRIVDVNTEAVALYLSEQIAAGVDAVMIFDTWGGMLAAEQWRRFSFAPMRSVR